MARFLFLNSLRRRLAERRGTSGRERKTRREFERFLLRRDVQENRGSRHHQESKEQNSKEVWERKKGELGKENGTREREAKARRDDESGRSGSAGAGGRRRKTKFSERRVGRRENERGRKREQRGKQDEPVAGDGSPIGGRARHGERFRDLVELRRRGEEEGRRSTLKAEAELEGRRSWISRKAEIQIHGFYVSGESIHATPSQAGIQRESRKDKGGGRSVPISLPLDPTFEASSPSPSTLPLEAPFLPAKQHE